MHEVITTTKIIKENISIARITYDDWLNIEDKFSLGRIKAIQYASKTETAWKNCSEFDMSKNILNCVDVALTGGKLYKINGIIRKGMWEKGTLKKPEFINIHIYEIGEDLYQFRTDSLYPISARNKAQDIILSAYKKNCVDLNSDRLKFGYINDALNIALRGEPRALQDKRSIKHEINIDRVIGVFKKELLLIDKLRPEPNLFSTGILAATLIMLSIDETTIEFFEKLNKYQGETKNDWIDPVEALLRIIDPIKKKADSDGKIQIELCSKCIRAIRAWKYGKNQDSYWVKRLSSIDFLPDIRKMKQIKGIHGIKEL